MHAELVSGGCSDYAIVFKAGRHSGEPISRESGVTLYSNAEQVGLFAGIVIDYQESLSGGGFFLTGKSIDVSSCGNCFSFKAD
jgi:Fe-S cluster assembly iron-binding protein IscA